MQQSLHDAWWRLATQGHPHSFSDACGATVLRLSSIFYGGVVAARNGAYDHGWLAATRLPCRVISVGNLTVGGSGKTPCVEWLARKLIAAGHRVAIVSRGYAGTRQPYWLRNEAGRMMVNGVPLHEINGLADEPQLLARHIEGVPIVVDADRVQGGRVACEQFQADTILCDDAFQHRQLARDCDIVLINARMPMTGWALLPRGPMRESIAALQRADIIILMQTEEGSGTVGAFEERLRGLNPTAVCVTAVYEPLALWDPTTDTAHDVHHLSRARVGLLSSIGNPAAFETTMRQLETTTAWHQRFPDHYPYQQADWERLVERMRPGVIDAVVTTEKDWVRLAPLVPKPRERSVPLLVLRVRVHVLRGEEEAIDARLARLYAR